MCLVPSILYIAFACLKYNIILVEVWEKFKF